VCFDSMRGQSIFLVSKASRFWGQLNFLFRGYRVCFLPFGKPLVLEVGHSPPCLDRVKNVCIFVSIPPICDYGMNRDNFTVTDTCQLSFVILVRKIMFVLEKN
jgi:hypothetical protein